MRPVQTPSIRIHSSARQQQHAPEPHPLSLPSPISTASSAYSPSPALPMSVPSSQDGVPPPLPPPRHIDELNKGKDPGWQWANGLRPGSSHNESSRYSGPLDHRPEPLRAIADHQHPNNSYSQSLPAHSTGRIPALDRPESRDDDQLLRPNFARLQSETRLSVRTLDSSARQFDRDILNKLGGGAVSQPAYGNMSSSLPSPSALAHERRNGSGLQPLHVSDYRQGGPESPHARWPGSSPSAISAASASGIRSPLNDAHPVHSRQSPRHARPSYTDNREDQHAVYGKPGSTTEHNGYIDPELQSEGTELRSLDISDRDFADEHIAGSRKRRAPSPTLEDPRDHRSPGNQNDLYRRRSNQMLNSRLSPSSRALPQIGTPSTIVSSLAQSHGSHWGTSMASSATSYASERISPSAVSPPADLELPRLPRLSEYHENPAVHQDGGQWRGDRWESEGQNTLLQSMNAAGLYACECCLKKPRRFRTLQELKHHEAEKQYQCQYCPNRFKNKNEAERHQNSLHLRRNSWSCSALTTGRQAFHPHPVRPESVDICGYCGQEFPNPADWRNRNEHLVNEHKFGECNQQKKFFRADHFRQHLKHSHGAASGKWTAQLENICIKEEAPPQPLRATMEIGPARSIAPIASILHENQAGPSTLPPNSTHTLPPILPPQHQQTAHNQQHPHQHQHQQ